MTILTINLKERNRMFWAYKKTDGHIVVQTYESVSSVEEQFQNQEISKIILPFKADDLYDAAVKAGNKLEGGKFILMEKLKNGVEMPRLFTNS